MAQATDYVVRMENRLRELEALNAEIRRENHDLREYIQLIERRYSVKEKDGSLAMSSMLPVIQHPG